MPVNILSIQSHVAYGHVGNAAAVFPMQRLGVEVWPIHTVQFSNHTGYGAWTGRVFDGATIDELVEGIADARRARAMRRRALGLYGIGRHRRRDPCRRRPGPRGEPRRALLLRSGHRRRRPRRVRAAGHPGVHARQALPAADIVTPNQFELDFLSGLATGTLAEAKEAVAAVQRLGPRVVLVTSLHTDETPADAIDLLAGEGGAFWRLRTPRLSLAVNGAGDAIAALFLVHYARSRSAATALGEAAASVYGLLRRTAEAGSREILLVAAQDELVSPTQRFAVERV